MELAEKIKQGRQNLGMTQEELAIAAGTTKAAISHYERGQREPRFAQLQAIASVLGIPLYELAKKPDAEPTITIEYIPGEPAVFDEEDIPSDEQTAVDSCNDMLSQIHKAIHSAEQGERISLSDLQIMRAAAQKCLQDVSVATAKAYKAIRDAEKAKEKCNAEKMKVRRESAAKVQIAAEKDTCLKEISRYWGRLSKTGTREAVKRIRELSQLAEYQEQPSAVEPPPDTTPRV